MQNHPFFLALFIVLIFQSDLFGQEHGKNLSEFQSKKIYKELHIQSEKYQCDVAAIVLSWILKHPSKILPVIGSTEISRIKKCLSSLKLDYLKEDWYRIFEKRNGIEVP